MGKRRCASCGIIIKQGDLCDVCASERPFQITDWNKESGYRQQLTAYIVAEEFVEDGKHAKTHRCEDCSTMIERRSRWCVRHSGAHKWETRRANG